MKTVRMGIIGMGGIGCHYAEILLKDRVPALELTAVARIGRSKKEWAAEHLPEGVHIYASGEELLESGTVDAVLIATPHYFHEEYVTAAFQKGLHVLCEKPAGAYTLQAERMNEEAAKHSLVFGAMFQQRTASVYRKLKELLESGVYGNFRRFIWTVTDWYRDDAYYQETAWRAGWKTEGGGVLLNQAAHNLDMVQWLFGMPERVTAVCQEGKWHDIEVEDDATAMLEYKNGETGIFIASTGDYPGVNRLEIDLDMAQIVCENGNIHVQGADKERNKFELDIPVLEESNLYEIMLNNFAAAVNGQEELIAPGEEALQSLMLTNAMYLSSWNHQAVELPLNGEEYFENLKKRWK